MADTKRPDQTSILESVGSYNRKEWEGKISRARGSLYFISAAQIAVGIFEYVRASDAQLGVIAAGIDWIVAWVFFGLAMYAKKKPYICLVIALVFYVLTACVFLIAEPANLGRGILLKVIFVVVLVKGIQAAKEAEALRKISGED